MAIFGWGNTCIADQANGIAFIAKATGIELAGEAEQLEARGWVNGKSQVLASQRTSETHTLTLTYEDPSWVEFQLALGQKEVIVPTYEVPRQTDDIIPETGPYTVTVPGMTTGTKVLASIPGTEGMDLTLVETTPGPGEFQRASGSLTFNAAQAGKSVGMIIWKTYSSVRTIGVDQGAQSLGNNLEISFDGYTSDDKQMSFYAPQVTLTSLPSLSAGEVSALEMSFQLETKTGLAYPYSVALLGA